MKQHHYLMTLFLFLLIIGTSFSSSGENVESKLPSNKKLVQHLADTTAPKTSTILAPGATLQLVGDQFSFTEGPSANKKGEVFFTDQPNDKIWKYDLNGKLTIFLDKTGRANGTYFDKKWNLITCAEEKNELWCISPKGKVTVLLSDFGGKRFNGPNDIWIHPNGDIYFTDPYYQRPFWDRKSPDLDGQKVYYLAKGAKEAKIAESTLLQPNGIVGTPDGKYLYVADIRGRKTYKYTIEKDGKLSNRQLFVEQGSDGMDIDSKGNIYLTGNGVSVYNSEGKKIEQIDVRATTNVCFSGKDKTTLFITAQKSVYTIKTQMKGVR